jgi:tetratricopeptide (TPR) repeat protein
MKFRLFIFAFLVLPRFIFAQSATTGADSAAAKKPGKPLTEMDSVMVQDLFYSALREKTMENYTEAAQVFTRVLQVDPANAPAMYELANIKRSKDDYTGAQPLLERAVAISPDNEWYWLALADCYEKTNNVPKIGNVFNQLIRIDPNKPDYYFDKANVFFIEKRYDDALKVYDQLEEITGPDDDILASRQKIYLIQGKVDKAVNQVQKAIAANPGQMRYYLLLADLYNSNNFPDKALKVLQDAEKINPGNGQLHLALADIYRDKKNYQGCFDELKLAFAIPDMDIDQEIKIISGYFPKFPDPDSKSAALELSRLLTIAHPGDAKAYAIYGDMLYQNEQYKDAKAAYKRSIEIDGQRYEVYEQLVRIEISDDETDEAIKDGEYALTLFPNQAWMNYLVGVAWLQKKDYKKALSYIKDATSMGMDDKDLMSLSYSSLTMLSR